MSAVAVVSLGSFVSGLVLGVIAMLHGTERVVAPKGVPHERRSEHDPDAEPSPVANRSTVAAAAFGFGLTGYLVDRATDWSAPAVLGVALLAGGAAFALQSLLIARWAIPSARADAVDERFLLQGTLARVTRRAPAGGTGELVYALEGHEYVLPVQAMDGTALAEGVEVVIDRVEGGVAFAELWAAVEQRL